MLLEKISLVEILPKTLQSNEKCVGPDTSRREFESWHVFSGENIISFSEQIIGNSPADKISLGKSLNFPKCSPSYTNKSYKLLRT